MFKVPLLNKKKKKKKKKKDNTKKSKEFWVSLNRLDLDDVSDLLLTNFEAFNVSKSAAEI